ncbi:MAG: hypothetical protein CMJ83_05060 [Planctomycetes bacterium]|nr:hypothetical protein [Planctomycetota bacterium]
MVLKTLAALLVLCAVASAQYPAGAAGFLWQGQTTATAGTFCWGFSCTATPVQITGGETVTLTVRGDFNMPYLIGISAGANRCLMSPVWYNGLMLDDPIIILAQGQLTQVSGILACPNATDTVAAQLPNTVPVGATFSLQAAVLSGSAGLAQLSFTTTFDVTVL